MALKNIKTNEGQTIFDIAIQEYGTVEGALQLLKDNANVISSFTDNFTPGDNLVIDQEVKFDIPSNIKALIISEKFEVNSKGGSRAGDLTALIEQADMADLVSAIKEAGKIAVIDQFDGQDIENNLSIATRNKLNYINSIKTGQTASYAEDDDGDLENGRLVDFYTLSFKNKFGNTLRFTNTKGAQIYDGSDGSVANYKIDHATNLGWYLSIFAQANWETQRLAIQALAYNGWSWFMPNKNQLNSVYNAGKLRVMEELYNQTFYPWVSNTNPDNSAYAYSIRSQASLSTGQYETKLKTNNSEAIACRYHF